VGTFRRNERYTTKLHIIQSKAGTAMPCHHEFHEPWALVSYIPKKNRSVVLLLTMHKTAAN
jgi:hypothetical protein